MSKPKTIEYFSGKWWVKEGLWDNVGSNVISRPTEHQAISNINLQSKYIRSLSKWDLQLTFQELEIYRIDRLINHPDFDTEEYSTKEIKVYKKDMPIVKISKISGYSQEYCRKLLKSISGKVYLSDVLGIVLDLDKTSSVKEMNKYKNVNNNKYLTQKKNKYYHKLSKLKRNVS